MDHLHVYCMKAKLFSRPKNFFTYLTVKRFMHNQVCGKYVCNQLVTDKEVDTNPANITYWKLFTDNRY